MPSRQAAYNRRVRARRVADGMCRDCGKPADGRYRCDEHRAQRRLKKGDS